MDEKQHAELIKSLGNLTKMLETQSEGGDTLNAADTLQQIHERLWHLIDSHRTIELVKLFEVLSPHMGEERLAKYYRILWDRLDDCAHEIKNL